MKTELLAPAGDIEAAYSAFYYGADAVYLGLRRFSARAEAVNFSSDELNEITDYAHKNGKKVYVTVNTLAQEKEIPQLMEMLSVCNQFHVDAVIVQDWGVARLVREHFPKLALHASTQMAVHNLAGVRQMKKMGFSRVVLARELTLTEIKNIQKQADLELEVFIHGALCYSYSGLCLFSSLTTGRSANRGKCVYSCRSLFRTGDKQYHPFSMKDLALEKDILKLTSVSLKIEGRKKNALYVGAVTDYYRRILDTGRTDARLTDNLKQIFARPWTKLHFNGHKKDVTDTEFVGHRGLLIGQAERVFNHTITFKTNRDIARYDGIQIDIPLTEKPFGFSAEQISVNKKSVFHAVAGQTVTLTLPPHHPFIQKGNLIYLASSTRVKGAYPYPKPKPGLYKNRQDIDVDVFIQQNEITACSGGVSVAINEKFASAKQPEKTQKSVQQSFEKTGDTDFNLKTITCHNPDNLFVPISVLNDLRRTLYSKITVAKPEYKMPRAVPVIKKKNVPGWIIKSDDFNLLKQIKNTDELIYVIHSDTKPTDIQGIPNIRLALPTIIRNESLWQKTIDILYSAGFIKWEVSNPCGLSLLPKGADISLDSMVSMFNMQAIHEAFTQKISRITFSTEDTKDNIKSLAERTNNTVLVVYQDIPLFISANCIRENDCRDCPKNRLEFPLTDGKGIYSLISENCQTVVTDARPFAISHLSSEIPADFYRIDFCYKKYTPHQALKIIQTIKQGQPIVHSFTGNFEKQFAI